MVDLSLGGTQTVAPLGLGRKRMASLRGLRPRLLTAGPTGLDIAIDAYART